MVASWMLYVCLVGVLLGGGAAAAERVLRDRRMAARWLWGAAVCLSLAVPLVGLRTASSPDVAPVAVPTPLAGAVATLEELQVGVVSQAAPFLVRADAPLLIGWGVLSALLLAFLVATVLRLTRVRELWREAVVDGTPVLVSPDVGPAVLGVLRQRIVLPTWALERDAEALRLMLDHEREHVRARDPLLFLSAVLAAVLVPWNLPIWWQVRRLRLALEMDCDQRVLRAATPGVRRRYGHLLLEVGRRSAPAPGLAATFSEGRSSLERRILGLVEHEPRRPRARALALLPAGAALVVAACLVPGPDARPSLTQPLVPAATDEVPVGDPPSGAALEAEPTFTPMTRRPEILNVAEVRSALEREYPAFLRDAGIGGRAVVWFFIDEQGLVRQTRVATSSGHDGLDQAALRVAGVMRFSPAANRDRPVSVWVQFPITFQVGGGAPPGSAGAERPGEGGERPRPAAAVAAGPTFTRFTVRPEILNAAEVQRALEQRYPARLREAGVGGRTTVWFFLDEQGGVRETRVAASSGLPELDDAALAVARTMRFSPALDGDRPVPVWVQFPVTFQVR